jgi:activating signal cointegrator complex subunit 2
MEQMKADILRRAEHIADEEDEEIQESREEIKAFEDDVELDGRVKVIGDGEESGEDSEAEDEVEESTQTSETILELAYIQDPKLFERDANTRRSKARAELRAQTSESDYSRL